MLNRSQKTLTKTLLFGSAAAVLLAPAAAHAAVPQILGSPLLDGILSTILYSIIGLFMAFLSYRLVDLLTPGCMGKEITENQNVALAVLAGFMILGICIIIAAAVAG